MLQPECDNILALDWTKSLISVTQINDYFLLVTKTLVVFGFFLKMYRLCVVEYFFLLELTYKGGFGHKAVLPDFFTSIIIAVLVETTVTWTSEILKDWF